MFVFLEYKDVEPTNNLTEQAMKYVAVVRKISGRSREGKSGRTGTLGL